MKIINQLALLIILFLALKIYVYLMKRAFLNLKSTYDNKKLHYGLVSRKDIAGTSDKVFVHWCVDILRNTGLKNIHILSSDLSDNVQLLAYENYTKKYIKLIVCQQNKTGKEDDFEQISKPTLQEFVGTMEHDGINHGYVITNGGFSPEAVKYAETLPSHIFSVNMIDGYQLTNLHRSYQKQIYADNMKTEAN